MSLLTESTLGVTEIYGVNQNVRKSVFYQPAIEHSGIESTSNARDRKLHAWKRRILAPAFTDAALASMEQYNLPHIYAQRGGAGTGHWTGVSGGAEDLGGDGVGSVPWDVGCFVDWCEELILNCCGIRGYLGDPCPQPFRDMHATTA